MKPLRIAFAFALLATAAVSSTVFAQGATRVEVYKSPSCSCCGGWVEHMRENGFEVTSHDVDDVAAERKKLGMPEQLGSCHSAKIDGYVIEGHVPAADIRRLLKEKPRAIGLAVPGMVPSSPGMNGPKTAYDTLLVGRDGKTRVFAKH
ncbi:MAG: DUF411 domain-containing protein [Sulfuritalea sp.]|nr:DUF411 domain-containing protein [Sulfuritalea sp.]MCF8184637.1 DUF411 domain-containing protein [Polynucleobacter sp.]